MPPDSTFLQGEATLADLAVLEALRGLMNSTFAEVLGPDPKTSSSLFYCQLD